MNALKQLIAEITGNVRDALQTEAKLTELGFDSIMSIELVIAIQSKLGIDLPVMEIQSAGAIAQLAQLVKMKINRLKAGPTNKKRQAITSDIPQKKNTIKRRCVFGTENICKKLRYYREAYIFMTLVYLLMRYGTYRFNSFRAVRDSYRLFLRVPINLLRYTLETS